MRIPLLARIAARTGKTAAVAGGRKSFSQPAFWSQPDPWSFGIPWSAPDRERIGNDFEAYAQACYKENGIVFACMQVRQHVFSQVRFAWQELDALGRPGELVSTDGLDLLASPEQNRTASEMLAQQESDSVLAGNWYATVADDAGHLGTAATGTNRRIVRMRPDWVTIVIRSPSDDPYDLRARLAGYWYEPNVIVGQGGAGNTGATFLLPDEVAHYSPIPDPIARYRGMSPLTPILREIQADKSATSHKDVFFRNGAVLNTVVKFDKDVTTQQFNDFVKAFNAKHEGDENAYRTLFLGGGADVTVVGTDLKQLDFKSVQGGGETRIAAALRVHPVIVGLSEGMQGSSLNAGNYKSAKRGFVDELMRYLWATSAGSLATLVTPPRKGLRLWYDDDIPYLREDAQDAAAILHEQAITAGSLAMNGWEPDEVIRAVTGGDLKTLMGKHTGLFSVQLQEPGATEPTAPTGAPPAADDAPAPKPKPPPGGATDA